MSSCRVVTLPPSVRAEAARLFAEEARRRGAQLLELRTDLHHDADVDAGALARVLPLLVSERGAPVPPRWLQAARLVDLPVEGALEAGGPQLLASHHAERPLMTEEALQLWARPLPPGAQVKHVEPLGAPSRLPELLETQARLVARFGEGRVTVLAMGPLALPVRAVLAVHNTLDYVAAGGAWSAAVGQRLLEDVVRESARGAGGLRRGILGTGIAHSRSPRIHRQPFDRIDLPEDADVEALVDALRPHYAGFAITSPFKKHLARHAGSALEAVNTLVRRGERWEAFNTDHEGAREVLQRLRVSEAFVLGDGGASAALRAVAPEVGTALRVLRRADVDAPLRGAGVWTWPERVEVPPGLRFEGARVAVIAYGAPGRRIAAEIRRRGGEPVPLGAAWFVAQARRQRSLWETAT
ncbi:shikimate dehydrogenase [Aggregicoccus sp. 17bor-14]|uniref:shikimate dehydrogenase n=1 Tax=Myxococcaceae TaxID=31 RepID=UPI0012F46744|nr:shikimate dehydrogenase [Simulacricoccus sp. 17bor-14]MRI89717.1 shikimate dehydrogenase [Aggregicoccus sp. 17bor-14]